MGPGPEELERCLFPETLALVAAGGRGGGHLWVGARPAPYKREGQRVRSCLLVHAECRGELDGVPFCSTLKGETPKKRGMFWGGVPKFGVILVPSPPYLGPCRARVRDHAAGDPGAGAAPKPGGERRGPPTTPLSPPSWI